jgi:uncharacterized protein (DUF2062 family)
MCQGATAIAVSGSCVQGTIRAAHSCPLLPSTSLSRRREGAQCARALASSAVRRWLRICARLWESARSERSSPREIGWSIALGVFSGCTPFVGVHLGIALALATLLRLNRLWAALGSRISFAPVFACIAFCEIETGHRVHTGGWVPLSPHEAVARGKELVGDWLLGAVVLGGSLALVCGLAAYLWARRCEAAPAQRVPRSPTGRTPFAPRLRSSGSPPSTPAAPTR